MACRPEASGSHLSDRSGRVLSEDNFSMNREIDGLTHLAPLWSRFSENDFQITLKLSREVPQGPVVMYSLGGNLEHFPLCWLSLPVRRRRTSTSCSGSPVAFEVSSIHRVLPTKFSCHPYRRVSEWRSGKNLAPYLG